LSNASQHVPIYLRPFSSNSTRKFKSSPFLAHYGLPWVRLLENRGKCYMDGKRIQCLSNASQHIPIYLQPFTSYSYIGRKLQLFPTPLHLTPPLGVFPLEFREKFGPQKLRIMENHGATRQWRQFDDRLSCFDTIPACDGQTDRRTDVQSTACL